MSQDNKPLVPPTPPPPGDWRDLAERASKEPDGEKLTQMIQELCDRIDSLRARCRLSATAAGEPQAKPDSDQSEPRK